MGHLDRDQVREEARGRWPDVIGRLAPQLRDAIDRGHRKHGPCPVSGGKDGLRVFDNFTETGGVVCNTCGEFSDGFATIMWSNGWDFPTTLEAVADALGMTSTNGKRPATKPAVPVVPTSTAEDEAKRRGYAKKQLNDTWTAATKDTGRVSEYLRYRGLSGDVPSALRLHPALDYYNDDEQPKKTGNYPALLARMIDQAGYPVTLHRIYLDVDGPGKAPVPTVKKTMTATRERGTTGAAIRLFEPTNTLAITEGIETALAIHEATGVPVWSCKDAHGLAAVVLPPSVKHVYVWADLDESNTGQEAAEKVAARFTAEGREVFVLIPPRLHEDGAKGTDWLDVLNAQGATVLQEAHKAAQLWTPEVVEPEADEWEQPLRLDTLAGLPPFPVQALPPVLREFVTEVAETVQVPVDMAAMGVLGVIAAGAAGRYLVQLTSHSEPCNLYLLCAVDPATRKSQTIREVSKPLYEAEARMLEEARQSVAEAQAARDVAEQRVKHLQTQAAKLADPQERRERQAEIAEVLAAMPERVAPPRLLVDDVTPEKLGQLLAENHGTLAMITPEGGVVGMMAGRYNDKGGPNLDVYTKGHAGDPFRVDRASGQPPVQLTHPALTLCLMVQPEILGDLANVKGAKGRGLLGRFLYSFPVTNLGSRPYQDRAIDPTTRTLYEAQVYAMLAHPLAEEPRSLLLRGPAVEVYREFHDGIEYRLREDGDLHPLSDWAGKIAGAVARIAGVLHACEHAHDRPENVPIAPETVEAAVTIGNYFVSHAKAAYGVMGDSPSMALARWVASWIDRAGHSEFSLRDLYRAKPTQSQSDLLSALRILEERSIVRKLPARARNTPGRLPARRFIVNPDIVNHRQNGQNTTSNTHSVYCVSDSRELESETPEPFTTTQEADGVRVVAL